ADARSAVLHRRFREPMAGRGQGGVLQDSEDRLHSQNAYRATFRARGGSAGERLAGPEPNRRGPPLPPPPVKARPVDACHLFIAPIIVGDGNSAFPSGIRFELALQDERRFRNGMVYLHYRSTASQAA